jgi:hypothetical protein
MQKICGANDDDDDDDDDDDNNDKKPSFCDERRRVEKNTKERLEIGSQRRWTLHKKKRKVLPQPTVYKIE